MEYSQDDYLMISGIQHFKFCRRQWALIHIEQQWAENVKTIEGQFVHERADQPELREKRGDKSLPRRRNGRGHTPSVQSRKPCRRRVFHLPRRKQKL